MKNCSPVPCYYLCLIVQEAKKYRELQSQMELKEHEVKLLNQRLSESEHGQLTTKLQVGPGHSLRGMRVCLRCCLVLYSLYLRSVVPLLACILPQDLHERLEREETGLRAATEGLAKARAKVAQLETEMRDVEGAKAKKLKDRSPPHLLQ